MNNKRNLGYMVLFSSMVLFIGACKKESNKICYICEITGSLLGPQYNKTVEQCVEREQDLDLDWQDPAGNDMNCVCRLK